MRRPRLSRAWESRRARLQPGLWRQHLRTPHNPSPIRRSTKALLPSELGWPAVRILLAEDSPTNQMVIRAMLQNTGYRVDVVSNGLEALEALQRLPYDLVLMDVFMPEMDGVTATRKLRERFDREHLPVVALTANAMQGDEERFLAAGMNEHLTKPLERAALLRALHRWLEPTMTPSPAPSQPSEELHNA